MNTDDTQTIPDDSPFRNAPLRRQQSLPGIAEDIPEVEHAAIALRRIRAERMEAQKAENVRAAELIAVMAANDVQAFAWEDEDGKRYRAKITHKTKVSVKIEKPETDDAGDAEGED
jgi:hypothetical protein